MDSGAKRGVRKEREGVVVGDGMDKTRVVRVERRFRHPVYGKEMRRSSKLYVHDEKNESHKGDIIRVVETRPLSRLKRWRLIEVVRKAEASA